MIQKNGELCGGEGVASSQVDSDSISVGSESEYGMATRDIQDKTDPVIEKITNTEGIETTEELVETSIKENKETEPVDHMNDGLYLLTEGIACMERRGTVRHSSVDSYHHKKYDNLQILCDVANQQIKEKVGFVT